MKHWKQVSIYCLAAALTAAGPATYAWAASPSFARSAEEWAKLQDNVMEYGELAGLVHEYNTTVLKNNVDLNDQKNKGYRTSEENAQRYRNLANDARAAMTGENAAADAGNEIAAANYEQQADNMVEDYETGRLSNDQAEANLVAAAQSSMISYYQQQLQLEAAKSNKEMLDAVYQSTVAQKNVGTVTQMEVLSAQENIQNADVSMNKLNASIIETKQKLNVMLGWKFDASPEIGSIPAVDMDHIGAMDPAADLTAALTNNYTLNINKRKYDNAKSQAAKESLSKSIADNEQNIGASLTKNYQAVQQKKDAYDQAAADLNVEAKNQEAAARKFQMGMISSLAFTQQKNTYTSKEIAVKNAQLDLFQAVQTYDNAVNGLATTGG